MQPVIAMRNATGFTLIEVLIAVVVLSIGLLGLAALQFNSLRGNSQSYERTQAHLLAGEIIDIMRAHRDRAAQGDFNINQNGAVLPIPTPDCSAAACTSQESADYALTVWFNRFNTIIPGAGAQKNVTIQCSTVPCRAGVMHTVTLSWDPDRTATTNAAVCDGSAAADFTGTDRGCITLSFIP